MRWSIDVDGVAFTGKLFSCELVRATDSIDYFKFKSTSDIPLESTVTVYFDGNKVLTGYLIEKVTDSTNVYEYTVYEKAFELKSMFVDYGGSYRNTWVNLTVDDIVDRILDGSGWVRGSSDLTVIPSISYENIEKLPALYKLLWNIRGKVIWFDNDTKTVYFGDYNNDYSATSLSYIRKTVKNQGLKPTKIIVLGSGDGINQLYAERGTGLIVRKFVFRDLKTQEEVDAVADQLYNEYVLKDDSEVEVKLPLSYYYLMEGDLVNLDGTNYVVHSVHISTDVTVTLNRPRKTMGKILFNSLRGIQEQSYFAQGVTNVANFGGWETAVDPTHSATYRFYLPDDSVGLIRVNEAFINVYGRPYRIWSKGGAATPITAVYPGDNVTSDSGLTRIYNGTTWETVASITPTYDTEAIFAYVYVDYSPEGDPNWGTYARLYDSTDSVQLVRVDNYAQELDSSDGTVKNTVVLTLFASGNFNGKTIDLQIYIDQTISNYVWAHGFIFVFKSHTHGPHVHDIEPGIYETTDYPSNVRVYVNGTDVSTTATSQVVGTGDGTTTSFSATLTNTPVVKKTVSIIYTIGGTQYTATDDGAGNISGTNCSGTIDYSTGAISLTFSVAPDSNTTITADYRYFLYPSLVGGTEFSVTKIDIKDQVVPGENVIEIVSDTLGNVAVDGFYRIFIETSK